MAYRYGDRNQVNMFPPTILGALDAQSLHYFQEFRKNKKNQIIKLIQKYTAPLYATFSGLSQSAKLCYSAFRNNYSKGMPKLYDISDNFRVLLISFSRRIPLKLFQYI